MYKNQQQAAIKAAESGADRLALRHNIAALKTVNPVGGRAWARDRTIQNLESQLSDPNCEILSVLRSRLKRECGLNVTQLESVWRVAVDAINSV